MEETIFITNLAGKIRNTRLPKSKALLPLFEAISNSIHAIEETETSSGRIDITVIRNGNPEILREQPQVDKYPIHTFIIEDTGVGFNQANYESFLTAESEYKLTKGAKGIGRFVCLKAFKEMQVESTYKDGDKFFARNFTFKTTGIPNHTNQETALIDSGTKITLKEYRDDYQDYCPFTLPDLGSKIIEHFLVYFLLNKIPDITLYESTGGSLNLRGLYESETKSSIISKGFELKDEKFQFHVLKLSSSGSKHTLHYCANEREVSSESLERYIHDLGKRLKDEEGNSFSYQVYVTGNYLDRNVDSERTGFDIPKDEDSLINKRIISFECLVGEITNQLEETLKAELDALRTEKFEEYREHILEHAPEYKPLLKHKPEAINGMVPHLKGNRLDIELMKVQNQFETEVKELGEEILNSRNDITNIEEYKDKYEQYVEKFNDLGKSKLARYIVHRKAVIELLEQYLEADDGNKFMKEDAIHNIFFPIKTESDEISFDKQNLWLIDERLAYHEYLASDKPFRQIPLVDSESEDRTDLLIFNNSFAFVEDDAPHQSFVIVEFKRPERTEYSDKDEKKNPMDQVTSYIRTIRESTATDRRGKMIFVNKERTPFYAYIVCDFNPKLTQILNDRNYKSTPDGMGFFYFHEQYNAYIEVISYQKLLKDAKKKNRILFDKLGLPT